MATDTDRRPIGKSRCAPPADQPFVPPPRRLVALSLVCVVLSMFLAAMSQTVVATLLPRMVADLGGFERYTWVATSYMVAATVAYPIVGRLSDMYGRRRFLVCGLAVFVVGSVLVGLSTSLTQVVAFRAVQGVGGGIVMTCCYVSIADLAAPAERGKLHGLIGAAYGVASVAGPILGGGRRRPAFLVLGVLPDCPGRRSDPDPHGKNLPAHRRSGAVPKPDYPGMLALILAVVPILVALSFAGVRYDWYAPQIIGLLAFGLAMIGVFAALEARASAPIMALGIYADRVVGVAVVLTLLTSLGSTEASVPAPLPAGGARSLGDRQRHSAGPHAARHGRWRDRVGAASLESRRTLSGTGSRQHRAHDGGHDSPRHHERDDGSGRVHVPRRDCRARLRRDRRHPHRRGAELGSFRARGVGNRGPALLPVGRRLVGPPRAGSRDGGPILHDARREGPRRRQGGASAGRARGARGSSRSGVRTFRRGIVDGPARGIGARRRGARDQVARFHCHRRSPRH